MDYPSFDKNGTTFTTATNGTTVDASIHPVASFSIQVTGTVAAALAWSVVLEGSLDGVTFTTLLTHNDGIGNGVVLYSGANKYPSLYYRARCVSITLGSATNIVVKILGTE